MDRGDSQISGQMIVVDISDQVFAVVIELKGFSKKVDCVRQVLLQDAKIEISVPRVFAIMPEVRRPKKRIERGIVRVTLNGTLQLGLCLGNRAVLIAVIDTPESFDRCFACTSICLVLMIIVCCAACEAGQQEQGYA